MKIFFKLSLIITLHCIIPIKIVAQSFQKTTSLNVLDNIVRNLQDEVFGFSDTALLNNRILPIISELRCKDKLSNLYADFIEISYHIHFPWESHGYDESQLTNNEHYKKAVKMLPILKQQISKIEYEDNFERIKLDAYIYYLEFLLSHYHNDKAETLRLALLGYETIAKYPNKAYLRVQIIENVGHFYLANSEWELAFKYLDEAEKTLSEDDLVSTKVQVYNNLGLYYRQINNSQKALFYFYKIPSLVEHTRIEYWKGLVSGNIAVEYEKVKDWNKAKKFTHIDYEYSLKTKQWDSAALDVSNIIKYKIELNEKTGYKELLHSLDTLEKRIKHNRTKESVYSAQVKYYTYIKDFETANHYYSKLYEISKVIFQEKINANIKSVTAKHELEKEQNRREFLEKEQETSKKERNIAIAMMLFSFIMVVYVYENTQKKIKIEQEKEWLSIQRAKELSEINQYKNQLFSIMSHDLKAPALAFQNIVSSINVLLKTKQYTLLTKVGAHAEILASNLLLTINNLFQQNLMDQGNFKLEKKTTNLYHLILQVQKEYTALMSFKHITSQIKIADHWKENEYETFTEIVALVLRNLWNNAIKFSNEGGTIVIDLEYTTNNKMILKVIDNGIGISEEKMKKIFQGALENKTNGTNGEKGSGIGLMLCKQLAVRFEMGLSCQSAPNYGTTFILEI